VLSPALFGFYSYTLPRLGKTGYFTFGRYVTVPMMYFKCSIRAVFAFVGVVTIGVRKIENKALGRAIPSSGRVGRGLANYFTPCCGISKVKNTVSCTHTVAAKPLLHRSPSDLPPHNPSHPSLGREFNGNPNSSEHLWCCHQQTVVRGLFWQLSYFTRQWGDLGAIKFERKLATYLEGSN